MSSEIFVYLILNYAIVNIEICNRQISYYSLKSHDHQWVYDSFFEWLFWMKLVESVLKKVKLSSFYQTAFLLITYFYFYGKHFFRQGRPFDDVNIFFLMKTFLGPSSLYQHQQGRQYRGKSLFICHLFFIWLHSFERVE